jgi:TolB-like protein
MAKVWPGLVVEEGNIQVHISAIRKALGEDLSRPRHLFTAPGRGYRLVDVDIVGAQQPNVATAEAVSDVAKHDDRPSIAVLPFQNLSSDPEQEYFADGMVEDIITGLARIKWLLVIARNSSFTFKGRIVDVRQAGRDLGVRYVLQGSVRKPGDRIRIAAQLIETQSGIQVWGERYERRFDDVFALQDEIAIRFEEHNLPQAFDLFDDALAVSGSNFFAMCTSAVALSWSGKGELAIQRAQRALKLSPFDPLNHLSYQALSGANFQIQKYAEACDAARRAVELNPSFSVPYLYLAAALIGAGRVDEAKAAAQSVLRLDPSFTIGRFAVTVGVEPEVFSKFAEAWRAAGLPD